MITLIRVTAKGTFNAGVPILQKKALLSRYLRNIESGKPSLLKDA